MSYSEGDIAQAINAVRNGVSIRRAALDWGIPRKTLHNRFTGTQPRKDAFESRQRLSKVQESHLAEWIHTQVALGLPPTHAQLHAFAERVLVVKGDTKPLGKRWVNQFIKRNPSIKAQRSQRIDSLRINGASTDIIKQWFRHLAIPKIKTIKPANRWNMDEAGLLEGQGSNGIVLGSSESRAILKTQPGSRIWTSFIECISATGQTLSPLVIFRGKTLQQQWFPPDLLKYDHWNFTASPNGWTSDAIAVEWLKKIFIPSTKPQDPQEARLLIFDGHRSHESTEFMFTCFENNIHLLFLPPHSSHVLQPLDISIFSPLKRAYRKYLGDLGFQGDSTVINKRNFVHCYERARNDALTSQNIRNGWKGTGLWPISMTKPLMSSLLLENRNSAKTSKNQGSIVNSIVNTPSLMSQSSIVAWSTLRKAQEVQAQLSHYGRLSESTSTQRLLFQKLSKGFDEKDVLLASALQRIEVLEAEVEVRRPRKRKAVKLSPNSKFARIEHIHKAQLEAGDFKSETDESSEPDLPIEADNCMIVGVGPVVDLIELESGSGEE